ncbi:ubiquinol-cytochrome C reductase hinge protein-domain-containing protein [Xylaria castorea]|nr:ubiquinol-cytochrome C reductase hinge protein-domain-containing protein [Xylaria castorea]
MGVWDVITDLVEAAAPWSTAEAEAPQAPAEEKETTESQDTKSKEASSEKDSKSEEKEEGEEEPEEEEEEEEELEDPKEKFEEECKNSKQCAPAKHHFDECVERVTNASDDNEGEQEDCVEEFFHLAHCATQCAAPKLWSVLK